MTDEATQIIESLEQVQPEGHLKTRLESAVWDKQRSVKLMHKEFRKINPGNISVPSWAAFAPVKIRKSASGLCPVAHSGILLHFRDV